MMNTVQPLSGSENGPDAHLERIVRAVIAELKPKYRNGQAEHGGHLWEKPRMLAHLTEESLDTIVYAYTLREQLTDVLRLMLAEQFNAAYEKLRAILEP